VPATFSTLLGCFDLSKSAARRTGRELRSEGPESLELRTLPSASVILVPLANFYTTESGKTAQFLVSLSERPTLPRKAATVTIPLQSSDPSEGAASVSSLVFTSQNWNVPRLVTVTGVDDHQIDGNQGYQIQLGKLKTNAKDYRGVNPHDLTLVNKDDDGLQPGILIAPSSLIIDDGGSKFVSIHLASKPVADVTLSFNVSEGDDQARLSVDSFVFTSKNWNVAQTLIVGAFADGRHDGDQPFVFALDATSSDLDYDRLSIAPFKTTIHDTDPLIASLTGTYQGEFSGQRVINGETVDVGDLVNFTVTGTTPKFTNPTGSSGTITGDQIAFTDGNGVKYTGAFTENADGSTTASGTWTYSVNGAPAGSGVWSATDSTQVRAGLRISPTADLRVDEGSTKNILFSLISQPTDNVVVTFVVGTGAGQAQLSTTSFTFTPQNWLLPQTLVVSGVADKITDGDQNFEFSTTTTSSDVSYHALAPQTVAVTVHDVVATPTGTLDGDYTGTFNGKVLGQTATGAVAFSVAGNVVTVTKPASVTGTIVDDAVNFTVTSGTLTGAKFTGTFLRNDDGTVTAAGTWSSSGTISGSGTWTAKRPAAA
jgi:hypothetical protein